MLCGERHGGSLHGVLRRGSRHGSSHGSRHGITRHGSILLMRSNLKNGYPSQNHSSRAHKDSEEVAGVHGVDGVGPDSCEGFGHAEGRRDRPLPSLDIEDVGATGVVAQDPASLVNTPMSEVLVEGGLAAEVDPWHGGGAEEAMVGTDKVSMEHGGDAAMPAEGSSVAPPTTRGAAGEEAGTCGVPSEPSFETAVASPARKRDSAKPAFDQEGRSILGEPGTVTTPSTPLVAAKDDKLLTAGRVDVQDPERAVESAADGFAAAALLGAETKVAVAVADGPTGANVAAVDDELERNVAPRASQAGPMEQAGTQDRMWPVPDGVNVDGGKLPIEGGVARRVEEMARGQTVPTEEEMSRTEMMAPTEEQMAPRDETGPTEEVDPTEQVASREEMSAREMAPTEAEGLQGKAETPMIFSSAVHRGEGQVSEKEGTRETAWWLYCHSHRCCCCYCFFVAADAGAVFMR